MKIEHYFGRIGIIISHISPLQLIPLTSSPWPTSSPTSSAPVIELSYDKLLLGDEFHQKKISSEEWAKSLEHMHDKFDTTEHIIQNVLIELPQPGGGVQRPKNVKARAIAHGIFYKRDGGEGRPCVMALRNGGSYKLELVRIEEKEEKGENPWRISGLDVTLDWQDRPSS